MLLHGAVVVPVEGTYDDAFRLSLEYTARHGGLNRNTAYHPLTIEGKKTVGLEIWQQNAWRPPSVIVVPTGDGVILAGVHKAFEDLREAGLISQPPRLVCVAGRELERDPPLHPDRALPRRGPPVDDRRLDLGLGAVERASRPGRRAPEPRDRPSP